MVDVVVNNVMSTSLTPDYSKYFFNDPVSYTVLVIKPESDVFYSHSITHIARCDGVTPPANRSVG